MPRLPEIHQSTHASTKAFQVKKNSAAMAPMWNPPIKKTVIQLTGSVKLLSPLMTLMVSVVLKPNLLTPLTTVACEKGRLCNTCVISAARFRRYKWDLRSVSGFQKSCTKGQVELGIMIERTA